MAPTSSFGRRCFVAISFLLVFHSAQAEDMLARVRKAVERSTLDQPGTHPFHLRASLVPSPGRDKDSGRIGEVEIWWQAPGQYRREVRSSGFHQIEIVSGGRVWQKNDGDYFPDWLREMAEALIQPLPPVSAARKGLIPDEVKTLPGNTYLNWELPLPLNSQPAKEDVALTDSTGLLFYDGGLGWGALFKDYASFHGRNVARTLTTGIPEVTAKVLLLEDLPDVASGWFDSTVQGSDPEIKTVAIDSTDLAADISGPFSLPVWPEVTNTPLTGVVSTDLVLDRKGRIREPLFVTADNPAVVEAARAYFSNLQFRPTLRDGVPVQVVRRVVLTFELHRPAGVEDLGTARQAFEHGRLASTISAAASTPYVLRARFSVGLSSGIAQGTYVDTWVDANHWRREATLGDSRAVRSLDGDQQYLLIEGPQARVARIVLQVVEPIPAIDTFTESDWRLKRDTVDGNPTLRVLRGDEGPNGNLDPKEVNAYWFDSGGHMLQAYVSKLAFSYAAPQVFQGVEVPRRIIGRSSAGGVAMRLDVDEVSPLGASTLPKDEFRLRGHEWKRQFTSEVR
ncbi:hypothetical protein [Granulicella sp. S156]|jgi:hypothetical protein|uniref:hypothetical protein n=1 Tax=Granulicella sp. S156 TaxID=1747224 RepID=UPI00131C95F1|nr:hypothetical protein [Granulicella sp. S156]